MEKMNIGRDIYDMKEHDWFLYIHTLISFLRRIESYLPQNDKDEEEVRTLKNDLIININLGISFMKFSDTTINSVGELILGQEYYDWYEKWHHWLSGFDGEKWKEFDRKYSNKEDISEYLPDWYKI